MEVTTIYDLETNCLPQDKANPTCVIPTQVGYVQLYNDLTIKSIGTFYNYVDGMYLNKESLETSGLTEDFLKENSDDLMKNLIKIKILLYNNNIVGKNNTNFDDKVISEYLEVFTGDSVPFANSYNIEDYYSSKHRSLNNARGKGTLGDYVRDFLEPGEVDRFLEENGHKPKGAHDALWDAAATCLLYIKSLKEQGQSRILTKSEIVEMKLRETAKKTASLVSAMEKQDNSDFFSICF